MASNFTHAIVRRPSRSVIDGIADFANEGKPIYEKALEQHDAYIAALEAAGLEVTVLPALEEFPDSVFVEDTCIITPASVVVPRYEGSSAKNFSVPANAGSRLVSGPGHTS